MRNSFVFLFNIFILVFFCIPPTQAAPVPAEILPAPELIKTLQAGGNIIYMRHGSTNHDQKDLDRQNLKDCSRQRNLSAEGKELSKRIGRAIRTLGIPVGQVLSSPYCRCKDTARMAFGHFQIEPELIFSISKNSKQSKQLGERLYTLMMNSKPGSDNIVFVGHTSNLKDGLGVWPKPEGVVVVFKKQDDRIIYKGMITPDEWPVPAGKIKDN